MNPTAQTIVSFVGGGAVGSIIGHKLRVGSESAARRRSFRNFIAILEGEFDGEWTKAGMTDTEDFEKWTILDSHYASIPRFKEQAINVREDIRRWNRSGFSRACEDYTHYGDGPYFESRHALFEKIARERKDIFERLRRYAK